MSTPRERHLEKIRRAEEEMRRAGPVHRRDLQKHIGRMRKELEIYDRYHRMAAGKSGQ